MGRQTKLKRKPFTSEDGVQFKAVAVTATSDGTGTGAIPAGSSFVTVTSASADYIVTLPAPVVGTIIYLYETTNGFELRSSAPSTIAINGGTGSAVESAVSAATLVRCVCTTATTWVCNTFGSTGTEAALEAAA